MSRLHQNVRIGLSIAIAWIGVSLSGMALAGPCIPDESPDASCTELVLTSDSESLNIIVPDINIETNSVAAVTNRGYNNTLINNGTFDGIGGNDGLNNIGTGAKLTFFNNALVTAPTSGVHNIMGYFNLISNSGTISGGSVGIENRADSEINSINNTGLITSASGIGIGNYGTITELSNSASGVIMASNVAIYNEAGAKITTLNNTGILRSNYNALENIGTIGTLTNSNVLISTVNGDGLYNGGTISNLVNNGVISSNNWSGISNAGIIGSVNNVGTIGSNDDRSIVSARGIINDGGTIAEINNKISGKILGTEEPFLNINGGSINTITNTGSIYSLNSGNPSIGNDIGSVITTLNNAQGVGNVHGALTYSGVLPTNYNIIFNNPTSYGSLDASAFTVTGVTNFGIYAGSALTKGTYAAVLSGLTSSNVSTATRSGMYNGTAWTLALASGSSTIWDLIVQSSATNTLQSVQMNTAGLSTVYNQQAAAYQAALSYDCQVYDAAGLCVSVGGRYTYAGPSPSSNQQAGLVIIGYKPVQTFRVGAFADQSVNISTPTGFSQSKTSPMWGFFAKWHKNKDETGLGVQASAVTSASSLTSTRPQLFNTETGSGTTQFNGQGYQLTTNYHQPVTNNTSLVPYLGLRYTRINAGAYTENTTATVTSPLSYNAMAQNTFSAIGGIGVRSHLAEKLTGTASVGIQQNLNYSMGNYAGTSNITGLESFSVQMPGNVNSMATASAGLYYDVRKNERVGLNVLWQQQPFIATNTTTALATYTIGF